MLSAYEWDGKEGIVFTSFSMSYRGEIEILNGEKISSSLQIATIALSVTETPYIALHNAAHLYKAIRPIR